ncbi:MAG: hypothetical protein J6B93_04470, partial [Clostridia bacterium]|nr:hypothetical protein [Clostridia bacterium]
MDKIWKIAIDDKDNIVRYSDSVKERRNCLYVNDREIKLSRNFLNEFTGIDQPIDIGGKICRFILIGRFADVVVDGKYLSSGLDYKPLKNIPWWTWVFVALCALMPVVALGGAFPVAIAILGSIWCVRISVMPTINTGKKILYNML